MRVLGIDPGTTRMGYGLIEQEGGKFRCLAYGCLESGPGILPEERLSSLAADLRRVIAKYRPAGAVIEKLFFAKNARTALAVAEARGVALATLAESGVPVREILPKHVKSGVTGYGNAGKKQVQTMIQKLLGLKEPPRPDDAADALAIAFAGVSLFKNTPK